MTLTSATPDGAVSAIPTSAPSTNWALVRSAVKSRSLRRSPACRLDNLSPTVTALFLSLRTTPVQSGMKSGSTFSEARLRNALW